MKYTWFYRCQTICDLLVNGCIRIILTFQKSYQMHNKTFFSNSPNFSILLGTCFNHQYLSILYININILYILKYRERRTSHLRSLNVSRTSFFFEIEEVYVFSLLGANGIHLHFCHNFYNFFFDPSFFVMINLSFSLIFQIVWVRFFSVSTSGCLHSIFDVFPFQGCF